MAILTWSDQYLIGHEIIDAEHKQLFGLINEFHSSWLARHEKREISNILNHLVQYAEMHFRHEEEIMAAAGYADLAKHQQIHEGMFETIFSLHQKFEKSDSHLEQDTMRFVRAWLLDHILERDYSFRDFLNRKKKAQAQTAENATSAVS